jgi:erythronate-4-phosphate dehydrogenase
VIAHQIKFERRPRIVADENIPCVSEWFAPLGEVRTVAGRTLSRTDLADADILLVRSVTPVRAGLLAGTPVRFVGTATIGTDHLDAEYLRAAGIAFASAPGSNAQSVVDYVLSALATVAGLFERLFEGSARIGVVGLGNVGGRLLRRLRALGLDAVGYDPWVAAADLPQQSLDAVLACEVVCLHTPLTRTGDHPTWHLLDARRLAGLAGGCVLLNAGRGPVIDNPALLELVQRRPDMHAMLDVWEGEPAIDPALLERVALGTPHIAGYSQDGKLAGTRMLLEVVCGWLGQPVPALAAPLAEPRIVAARDGGPIGALRSALLAVYDPRRDDAALRTGGNEAGLAAHFDHLRRHYPVRREVAACRVANWGELDAGAQRLLAAAGFRGEAATGGSG